MPGWLAFLCKTVFAAALLNELRGAVLAVPVLWGMYQAGGTLMAIWLGICWLVGIALSVAGPIWGVRLMRRAASA